MTNTGADTEEDGEQSTYEEGGDHCSMRIYRRHERRWLRCVRCVETAGERRVSFPRNLSVPCIACQLFSALFPFGTFGRALSGLGFSEACRPELTTLPFVRFPGPHLILLDELFSPNQIDREVEITSTHLQIDRDRALGASDDRSGADGDRVGRVQTGLSEWKRGSLP